MKRLAFSDDMMRALAAGEKSMTRRPEKRAVSPEMLQVCLDGSIQVRGATTVVGIPEGTAFRPRFKVGDLVAATCAYLRVINIKTGRIEETNHVEIWYRFQQHGEHAGLQYKTSRVMPSALAPFVLRITDVKAEKLGEISELDAEREGAVEWFELAAGVSTIEKRILAAECFAELWNHVYGAGAWNRDRSSWVWAISFEIAERRI